MASGDASIDPDDAEAGAIGGNDAPRKLPQVVIVTGPTAVGKTAVGLELAQRLGGEVISADSVQVYRGLDIGSDKLPLAERLGVPHHLLDVRDVCDEFSAGDFHDEGRAAAHDILSRSAVPLVVGGTGFYLRWFTHGKAQGPRSTPEATAHVHAELEKAWLAEAAKQGVAVSELDPDTKWDAGVALLAAWGDPGAAQRIGAERNNYYRLQRGLALLHMTGRTLAELDVPTPQGALATTAVAAQPAAVGTHPTAAKTPGPSARSTDAALAPHSADVGTATPSGDVAPTGMPRSPSSATAAAAEPPASASLQAGQPQQALANAANAHAPTAVTTAERPAAARGDVDSVAAAATRGDAASVAAATRGDAASVTAAATAASSAPREVPGGKPEYWGQSRRQRKKAAARERRRAASAQQAGHGDGDGGAPALVEYAAGSIGDGEFDFRPFFLHRTRTELYDRIGARVEEMVFSGLLDEAAALLRQGITPGSSTASRAIGYRQAMAALQEASTAATPSASTGEATADGGLQRDAGARVEQAMAARGTRGMDAAALEQLVRDVIAATHKLVRGQMTWFRDDGVYRWVDMNGRTASEVADEIAEELRQPAHRGGCGSSGRLSCEEEQALKRYRPSLARLQDKAAVDALLRHVNTELLPSLAGAQGQPPA